ncbi:MAG: TonB-dependent receptor [Flavobacteriales bacterium]
MVRILQTICLLLLSTVAAFAQRGTITGTVTAMEGGSMQPQPFANVVIKGTTTGASTDLDGRYTFQVDPGNYTVVTSMVGYPPTERTVTVAPGATVVADIKLDGGAQEMQAVQVVKERRVDSEAAVLMETKKSDQVVNGLGRQQIAKGQDRTAGDVVKRIPGVTVVNDRFVMIRGLADRYNTVMLNDVIAPSLEPDKRAFSFDLLPSGALDRILIYKTGAPELPGEFAGGVIKIATVGVPAENETKITYGAGYRVGTTFGTFLQDRTSSTDPLGFDNGLRRLPGNFPAHLNNVRDNAALTSLGRELPNNWTASSRTAIPDQRLGVMVARRFGKQGGRNSYGNVTSIDYANTYSSYGADNYNYNAYDATAHRSDTIYHYHDKEYVNSVRVGILHNWSAMLGSRSKLEFRNLFNQLGENRTTERTGVNMEEGFDVRNYAFRYQQRSIYSGQLHGTHDITDKDKFDWTLGYGFARSQEPDFRRVRTVRDIHTTEMNVPYQVVVAPSASTLDAGRFFSDLHEHVYTGKLDYERKVGKEDAKWNATVRAGAFGERKDRDFAARWMGFKRASNSLFDQTLLTEPLDQVFSEANINSTTGFKLEEGTNPSDSYTAANTLAAGYAGATVRYDKRVTVSAGVRVEHNRQELTSATYGGNKVKVNNPLTNVLPSVNASYNLSEKALVRVAWSTTVNRPEFRELAPFAFYDFSFNNVLYGNPALKTATIQNVDARWEWYPSINEVVSVGAFYKSFTDPIEMFFVPGAGSGGTRNFTFRNAAGARSMGAELEVRRSLNAFFTEGYLSRIGVLVNASFIHSTVDLGTKAVGQSQERPMMGQSPYVLNAGLYYSQSEKKLQYNLVYNIFGKRLFAVGSFGTPDIYEMPRGMLDATMTKGLGEHFEVKLGVQNILDARTLLKQDANEDGTIDKQDEEIMSFRRGVYFSGGVSYRF